MYNSGRRGRRTSDGYGVISTADNFNQNEYPIPTVTSFSITDGSYNPLPDEAVDTAGGQTIVINGSGFRPGATVMVGGTTIGAVTYLDQGRLAFTAPTLSSASYTIFVINSNGGTGILLPGLVYSGLPTWSTSAGSIGSVYETKPIAQSFAATGDAPLTYALYSGTLPSGSSLASDGTLSGTAPADSGSTTYSFTIRAYDAQNQHSDRSFSLTINTDVVTWSTPSDNQVITSYEYAPITNVTASATSAAGYGVLYTANATPTGITIDANTGLISGTANTTGNTYTQLTATANTTVRNATRNVIFNVNQDVVTWSSPADQTEYTLTGGSAMSNVTLSASSAAGRSITYTANTLPSGIGLSGDTIYGTPDTAQTVTTLLTATAATTNRTATRTISWTISLGDLYWKNTTLLLNGATSANTFHNDSSLNNYDLKIVGDTKPNNLNPFQEGYYSNYFDGTGDYLSNTTSSAIGTGDFTVECWINPTASTDGAAVFSVGDKSTSPYTNVCLFVNTSFLRLYITTTTTVVWDVALTTTFPLNVWTHHAITRSGSTIKWFVNGVQVNTTTSGSGTLSLTGAYIGYSQAIAPTAYKGYISNFRVVNGTSLYNTNFTPPTTPLTAVANTQLLTCQSYTLLDRSVNNHTITKSGDTTVTAVHPFATPTTATYNTSYSVEIKGSGNYVSVPGGNSGFAFGTGDLTIEGWVYWKSGTAFTLFDNRSTTTSVNIAILLNGTSIGVYIGGSSFVITGSTFTTGQWYHIALVRISGAMKLYVNGTQSGSTYTSTQDFTAVSAQACIGGGYPNGTNSPLVGYISNVRVVKGLGVYTGNFTVPTSPLTATQSSGTNISEITAGQTVLLTCQDSKGIDNSSSAQTVNINGTAQPITVSPFTMTSSNVSLTGIGSTYFDGTGDYLQVPDSDSWVFNGDYTVEAWVYPTVLNAESMIFSVWYGGTSAQTSFVLEYLSSGRLKSIFTVGSSQVPVTGTSRLVVINQWNHLAVTRTGSSIRLFVNGIMDTTTGTSSGTNNNLTHLPTIGCNNNQGTPGAFLTGYMTNLRVVKGTSLYSSNFLPPQVPLTAVANTQLLTLQTTGGGNNNAIVDQSRFNNIITRSGNTTQGTFSPYSQTGWSYYMAAGGANYLSLTLPESPGTTITFEAWVYATVLDTNHRIFGGTLDLYVASDGTLGFSGGNVTTASGTITTGAWYHVAVTINSGVAAVYVNGVSKSLTGTNSGLNITGTTNYIGQYSGGGSYTWNGYISNLRLVKNKVVYTGNFTVPKSPLSSIQPSGTNIAALTSSDNVLLLTCQSNRFVDNSYVNNTLSVTNYPTVEAFSPFGGITSVPTSYSNYFDGSGDYLGLPSGPNTSFAMGTGDFTLEMWIYPTTSGSTQMLFDIYDGNSVGRFSLQLLGTGTISLRGASGVGITTTTGTVTFNQWNHIAISKASGSTRIFIAGTQSNTTYSDTNDYTCTTGVIYIGAHGANGLNNYVGYISNFRLVKGTALYTTTFTPSTTPLTAVANTSLLTCQSATMVDNSSNYFAITANGDVKPRTFNPFGLTNTTQVEYSPSVNGGSMYFDGTGDYLSSNNASGFFNTTTDNWTVQAWYYWPTTRASSTLPILSGTDSGGITRFGVYLGDNDYIYVSDITTVNIIALNTPLPKGAWTHVAVVNNSGTVRAYINGVRVASVSNGLSGTNITQLVVGYLYTYSWAGHAHLSDVNFTKAALYTGNFVPPVAPTTSTTTIGANTYHSSLYLTGTSGGIVDAHGSVNLETVGDTRLSSKNPFQQNTGKSIYFDGTGDYLSYIPSSPLLGSGNFTVECWVYFNSLSGTQIIVDNYNGSTSGWQLWVNNSLLKFYSGTSNLITGTTTLSTGLWYHFASVRSGTTITQYINGVVDATGSSSVNYNDVSNAVWIGGQRVATQSYLNGYIADLRITKGVARYTTTFTPPTAPLQVK